MGRLAGFRYREIVKRLKQSGFVFDRQAAGSHEIWYNPLTNRYTTLPNHPGELPEGTLRAVLKQAGIEVDDFFQPVGRQGVVSAPLRVSSQHRTLARLPGQEPRTPLGWEGEVNDKASPGISKFGLVVG